jgi:putative copper resistance protein D
VDVGATLVLWLHLLGAMFWVGGQLFLFLVVIPVLRQEMAEAERVRVAAMTGRRFAMLSGVALAVLLVTGPINAAIHGVSRHELEDTTWGHVLAAKVALVLLVLVLSGVHGGYFGRRLERLGRLSAHDPTAASQRRALQRWSVRLSALNLLVNLVIVGLAAWLATLP